MHTKRGAFSLVELAIVITIIGLLLGGILAGRDLMRGASIRSLVSDVTRYESAYVTFRDKFEALPGDFNGAVAVWGSAGGNGSNATCQNTASHTNATSQIAATCDGNGDNTIMTSVVTYDETYRAWQHLANAGLITGKYVGTTNGYTSPVSKMIGNSVPAAKRGGAGYQFFSDSKFAMGWAASPEGTALIPLIRVAAPTAASPYRLGTNAFSADDAAEIDRKLDDGKPGLGKVFVAYNANCINGGTNAMTATYALNTAQASRINCFYNYNLSR